MGFPTMFDTADSGILVEIIAEFRSSDGLAKVAFPNGILIDILESFDRN